MIKTCKIRLEVGIIASFKIKSSLSKGKTVELILLMTTHQFLQGLNIEIHIGLASARAETYAEVVEIAQRIEDCQTKLKEF